jgi:imidazolonepropionase-like amidohydrolase
MNRHQRRIRLYFFVLVLISSGATLRPVGARPKPDEVIVIVGAVVVDGTGTQPTPATVVIRGERIAAVGSNLEVAKGARVIHAEGQTLMPGIFDLHTHLAYSTGSVSGDWPKNVKAYLYCGVTSVVDFGTYPETFEPMRRLIASGEVPAPRISLAARITTPGGHGGEGGRGDFFSLEVQTPREARAAIRRLLPYHPDVIKAFSDGWRYGTAPDLTSMNEATLTALVGEAHKNGLRVLTHTVSLERQKIAARAGVDIVDHGIGDADADVELVELMRAKGTTYASTLAVYENKSRTVKPAWLAAIDSALRPELTAVRGDGEERANTRNVATAARGGEMAAARARRWQHLTHNIAFLNAAHIPIAVGTDAGETTTFHGWSALREMELLVASGMSPLDAIVAGTSVSAKALGVDRDRGTIESGKLADVVLVEGAPYRDIDDIERTTHVFLGGREVDRERLAHEIAMPGITPLPAIKIGEEIDDFEAPDSDVGVDSLRSKIATLWVNSTDPGADHSQMIFGRTLRAPGDHALSVIGRMSEAERPFVSVALPLSRGGLQPVDVRGYRGVRFDVRGDGEYRLVLPTRAVRNSNYYQAVFQAGAAWHTVSLDFAALKQVEGRASTAWTGADVLGLMFHIERKPGETGWLELDNLRLYK